MASIYELTADMQLLWNLMDEGTLEEEDLINAMNNSQDELKIKLEGYCKFIKNLESDIDAFKKEEQRIAAKRKTMENTIEKMKNAMRMAMETAGEKKLPCGTFNVSLQKNPPHLVLDAQDKIPERYYIPQEPKLDTKQLMDDLKLPLGPADIWDCAHLEQSDGLRIR